MTTPSIPRNSWSKACCHSHPFFFEAYLQFATKWGDDGDVMGTASSGRRLRKSGVDEAFELLRLA